MNLLQKLLRNVQAGPDRTAIVDGDRRVTYGQFAAVAAAGAQAVASMTSKERVGIALPSSLAFAVSYYATLGAGKTAVPVNFLLPPTDLAHIVQDADLDTVITAGPLAEPLKKLFPNVILIEQHMGALMQSAAKVDPSKVPALGIADDAPATILYTSGTSAKPKGVILTHRNLESNCDSATRMLSLDDSYILLAMLPFFHAYGLTTGLILPLCFGGRTVMLPRFAVTDLLDLVERHRVSVIITIPSIWFAMLRANVEAKRDLSSLDICVSGGEPLPGEVFDRFEERFGFKLSEGYGLTETAPIVSLNPPKDSRKGSAGVPLPDVEVRIVASGDSPAGALTPPSPGGRGDQTAEGEIAVRGPNVMKGYLNLPDETSAAMTDDGWFLTGDLGRIDAEGYLYVSGRKKDLIISAGENISPREIEEVILMHPGVSECAVIGVPDKVRGEVPKAFIVKHPEGPAVDEASVRGFCLERMAAFKAPRQVEFIDELPRSFTGKILKRKLVK